MAERIWVAEAIGSWFDPANWITLPPAPDGIPDTGDTVVVTEGRARVNASDPAYAAIEGQTITLGASGTDAPARLVSVSAAFGSGVVDGETIPLRLVVAGGDPEDPIDARFISRGTTEFIGRAFVEPFAGRLVIDIRGDGSSAEFQLGGSTGGSGILVTQESRLDITGVDGSSFVLDGLLKVEGFARIDEDVTVFSNTFGSTDAGEGNVLLQSGGRMTVAGMMDAKVQIAFGDGRETLTIENLDSFNAKIGLTDAAGDRIDLVGIDVASLGYDAPSETLTLHAGADQTGTVLGTLSVRLINDADLLPLQATEQTLESADFWLTATEDGTRITYDPVAPVITEASLAAPVVAEPGSKVPLGQILKQSFGTASPNFSSIELLPVKTPGDGNYWVVADDKPIDSAWIVNHEVITEPTTVEPGDTVQLLVGNNINNVPQLKVQVTEVAEGPDAGYVQYDVWWVDPTVDQLVTNAGVERGAPIPADIVTAAASWGATFPGVSSPETCNWIADAVAAAAGATMPLPNADLDPAMNVEGGFWRIAYRGSDSANPVQNWSTLVEPGDIVRMEWFGQDVKVRFDNGGHTTTVLGINDDDTITVYDNTFENRGEQRIGVHDVAYWSNTDPAGITIFRLDPNGQYLINGTSLDEFIQGTVYDDLIVAKTGDDSVAGGVGDDEIRGAGGDDSLLGQAGDDSLFGGRGDDVARGGGGEDRLTGGKGADNLLGNAGNDALIGSQGDDTLRGQNGDDRLKGGDGADELFGNRGDDELDGGLGNDILSGGPGDDLIAFTTALDATSNVDIIATFSPGRDLIALSRAVFTEIGHELEPDEFHVGTQAATPENRIIYDDATGELSYDPDGLGGDAMILFAIVANEPALSADDFVMVA